MVDDDGVVGGGRREFDAHTLKQFSGDFRLLLIRIRPLLLRVLLLQGLKLDHLQSFSYWDFFPLFLVLHHLLGIFLEVFKGLHQVEFLQFSLGRGLFEVDEFGGGVQLLIQRLFEGLLFVGLVDFAVLKLARGVVVLLLYRLGELLPQASQQVLIPFLLGNHLILLLHIDT